LLNLILRLSGAVLESNWRWFTRATGNCIVTGAWNGLRGRDTVSFWALVGVLLGLRAAGATLGWGFQFQSPVFLALIAGCFFFLGLSLAGQFEIGLTLTIGGRFSGGEARLHGHFFTGVLAVVVATPCTAPFMGAAVGYALSASPAVTFAVFTALRWGWPRRMWR